MAKNNQSAFVQMPSSTVAALKAMLFNSAEGVDLSGIINDIAGSHANADLTAINVGLAFSGYKPELDKTVRVTNCWEYGGTVKTAVMHHISLITNTVEMECQTHKYNAEKNEWTIEDEATIETATLDQWYQYSPKDESKYWALVEDRKRAELAKKNA